MFLDQERSLSNPSASSYAELQEARLRRLEEELDMLKQNQHRCQGPGEEGGGTHPPWQQDQPQMGSINCERSVLSESSVNPVSNTSDDERRGALLYELRRLVPHLSPEFDCGERDAVLILSAIQSGSSPDGGESWEHRLASLEAEKRMIQSKLDRRSHECEELKGTVAELRQKLRVTQEESHASMNLLSKRREEVRKQLLMEETRSQKLKICNGQLEMEMERLKGMLRTQMSK